MRTTGVERDDFGLTSRASDLVESPICGRGPKSLRYGRKESKYSSFSSVSKKYQMSAKKSSDV